MLGAFAIPAGTGCRNAPAIDNVIAIAYLATRLAGNPQCLLGFELDPSHDRFRVNLFHGHLLSEGQPPLYTRGAWNHISAQRAAKSIFIGIGCLIGNFSFQTESPGTQAGYLTKVVYRLFLRRAVL